MARGTVRKRGELKGGAVEARPPGEAEREAARAEGNAPIEAATGEPSEHGLMERPTGAPQGAEGRRERPPRAADEKNEDDADETE